MSVEETIKEMIDERFGGVPKFAAKIGVPASTIYTALKKGVANAQATTVMPMVSELGIDPVWLVKNQVIERSDEPDFVDVPLYGSIAAGTPLEMTPVDDVHPVPREMHERYPDGFLLRVVGESMNRVLPNGCFAFVAPCQEVDAPGKPYAVCVNGYAATIKRVRPLANGFELAPDSTDPTFRPQVFDYGEPGTETVTVIGRVVWYCVPLDWRF